MSGGNTSTALKSTTEEPACTADADAREAEAMADSMLRDSPIPETEEEHKQSEDVPVGKFVIPSPPISTFLLCIMLFTRRIFPRSSQSGGSCGKNWGDATCRGGPCGGDQYFRCSIGKCPATSR